MDIDTLPLREKAIALKLLDLLPDISSKIVLLAPATNRGMFRNYISIFGKHISSYNLWQSDVQTEITYAVVVYEERCMHRNYRVFWHGKISMKIINIECMESIKFICSFSFLIEISMRGLLLGASVIG